MAGTGAEAEGVRGILLRLRTRSGLNVERLGATEVNIQPIADLPVVRHYMHTTGASADEAVVETLRQLARQLGTTEMLIVDAVLALHLLLDEPSGQPIAAELYPPDLGQRRVGLVARWFELHDLFGVQEVPPKPTVRTLRSVLESRALGQLAELCVSGSVLEVRPSVSAERVSDASESAGKSGTQSSVLIIGGAVTDHIFVVDHVPHPGTSTQARSFEEHPGGKGLNQAVAATRLGSDAQLVAAVGDDSAGRDLIAYMETEGVRVDLIKVVAQERTPVVGVIVTDSGGSAVLGWKNEDQVRLDPADILSKAVRNAIERADAVLVTFESPIDVVKCVLDVVGKQADKPLLVLRPSPPFTTPQFLYEYLQSVDYLIATPWELRQLLPESNRETIVERLATQLLTLGVRGVCVTEEFGCLIRSDELNADIAKFPTALADAPGARDAFTAALTLRLLDRSGPLREEDLAWATAAMAAAQSFGGIPSSMPLADEVDRVLKMTFGTERPDE